jgi:two-component system, cell cycle sensor histidine kinase and response regulator CckA
MRLVPHAGALVLFPLPDGLRTFDLLTCILFVAVFVGLIIYLLVEKATERARKRETLSQQLRESKDALHESEERFRLLAENVPGVIYLSKGSDRQAIHYLNGAVEQLTGYPKEDFLRGEISLLALCRASDVPSIQAEIDRALAEHRPFHLLYRLKRRTGEWRWIEEFGVGIFQGSTLLHLEGFLSDVTDRKQAEEALRASEERYRLLFERNLAGVYRCSSDGHILECNEAFARMCGFASCNDALHHNGWQFFRGSPDRQAALTRLKKLGTLTNFETRLDRKDGQPIWVLENASLLKGRNGDLSAIEGTLFDITDRKNAEQMLDQLKRQNELILNSAGEGIQGLDLQGNTTFVNPAAARMLGRDFNDMIGSSHHDLLRQSSAGQAAVSPTQCAICATLRDGSMRHVDDTTFYRRDGASFPVESTCSAIRDERGQIVGAVLTFRDTTERTHLEEQLRRAQKMEAVGTLAGGVAHDFNNLLTGILGFTDIALEQVGKEDPLREDLNEIKKAAQRAASVTQQLLAFSRRQILAPQLLDLNTAVVDVEKMLRRLIGEDIDLVITRDPGLGRVKVDPSQVQQVIINLVVNARDAMPQGGRLTLSTANVDLDEVDARRQGTVKPGSYVMLEVTDTGIGMDEQTRSRLFEPFFTTKEKGKGTGLGLATAYGIVSQSGGHISVRSKLGHGTTFNVYLPRVAEETEPAKLEGTAERTVLGSETVLLVEDEESVRLALRRGLRSMGYTVLAACNGDEALALSDGHPGPIHLLLTDVVMPNMSGPELASRLMPLRPEMMVVYMSGYMDETVGHHGILDSTVAFLQKPFTQEVLAAKLREVLDAVHLQETAAV